MLDSSLDRLGDKAEDPTDWAPGQPPPTLASRGYEYVPGPTGDRSDWVLRKIADGTPFAFESQQKYDAVGAAVGVWLKERLVSLCGLEPLADVVPPATLYATPGVRASAAPLLLLVCGSAPGGDAGMWGRSLCINDSTQRGAMFDYIFRAIAAGWGVVVADPHGAAGAADAPPGGPRDHLPSVWRGLIAHCAAERVLIVAHSAGGALTCALFKGAPECRARVAAVAFTDASFDPPPHPYPDDFERHAIMFASVGRNFEASREPLGAIVDAVEERMVNVSAGHESHPATTHAATAAVFEFLRQGAAGRAAVANDELRVEDQLKHLPASVIGAVERKSFDGSGLADT